MSPDVADDDPGQSSTNDWQANDAPTPSAGSVKSDNDADDDNNISTDALSQPIQKRRRVTRACDECRRKKIKCDGKQPCTHCSVYSYGMRLELPPLATLPSLCTSQSCTRCTAAPELTICHRVHIRQAFKSKKKPRTAVHRSAREPSSTRRVSSS